MEVEIVVGVEICVVGVVDNGGGDRGRGGDLCGWGGR